MAAALAGESVGFHAAPSLAAMAVAARTYAVRFQGRHKAEGFDFCDTTHCQDIHLSAISDRLRQAAELTEGELLWFQGSPAATFYSKDCGGTTEAASTVWPDLKAPYLIRHDDPYCARTQWTSIIRKDELGFNSLRIVGRSLSGRATRLQAGAMTIPASTLRFSVGRTLGWTRLPSDLYEVTDAGDHFIFEGRGSGHGVGLCQAGAARMGEERKTYRQILDFYYPGTALGVTAQGLSWQALAGERVQLITTSPHDDQPFVALADKLARVAEDRSGLHWDATPRLRIYPTIATFRDATGEPGWVAASARGLTIRCQPRPLEPTILHELLHALVENRANARLPLWFREGAVLYLTAPQKSKVKKVQPPADAAFLHGQAEARLAYDAARNCFTALVDQFGESTVLGWISKGIPPAATQALAMK